jgi:hypothetical protein
MKIGLGGGLCVLITLSAALAYSRHSAPIPQNERSVSGDCNNIGGDHNNINCWPSDKLPASPSVPPALFGAQLAALKDIDMMIANKDEYSLRESLDYPNMIAQNVLLVKSEIIPKSISIKEWKQINEFKGAGSHAIIDNRYINRTRTPNGSTHFEWIPGTIGIIYLSEAHYKRLQRLREFSESSLLPSSVKSALQELIDAVNKNDSLLIDILNEQFRVNPKNITENDVPKSPFLGGVNSPYAARFIYLKPLAEKVSSAISGYLQVN